MGFFLTGLVALSVFSHVHAGMPNGNISLDSTLGQIHGFAYDPSAPLKSIQIILKFSRTPILACDSVAKQPSRIASESDPALILIQANLPDLGGNQRYALPRASIPPNRIGDHAFAASVPGEWRDGNNYYFAACALGTESTTPPTFLLGNTGKTPYRTTGIGYADPSQLAAVGFGQFSHLLQPWKAVSSTYNLNVINGVAGINSNGIEPHQAWAACRYLSERGFKHIRMEFGPGQIDPNTGRMATSLAYKYADRRLKISLQSCQENGVRPLILLNAHSGNPTAAWSATANLNSPAAIGDTTLIITKAQLKTIQFGTVNLKDAIQTGLPVGLDGSTFISPNNRRPRAMYFFLSVNEDVPSSGLATIQLSAPLHAAVTVERILNLSRLQSFPFGNPYPIIWGKKKNSQGQDVPTATAQIEQPINSRFLNSLEAWNKYVSEIARAVTEALGTDVDCGLPKNARAIGCKDGVRVDSGFDIEVWNELSFASEFLDETNYYLPPRQNSPYDVSQARDSVWNKETLSQLRNASAPYARDLILKASVDLVRSPSNHLANVAVTNGFSNQSPFPSANLQPAGLSALSKHPYRNENHFCAAQCYAESRPADCPKDCISQRSTPLDARGLMDTTDRINFSVDATTYSPEYYTFQPEFFINTQATEHLLRDTSSIMSSINYSTQSMYKGARVYPGFPDAPLLDAAGNPSGRLGMFVTEVNMASGDPALDLLGLSVKPVTYSFADGWTKRSDVANPTEEARNQAKYLMRYLVSLSMGGVKRIYFFSAHSMKTYPHGLDLMSDQFFTWLNRSENCGADQFARDLTAICRKMPSGPDFEGAGVEAIHLLLKNLATNLDGLPGVPSASIKPLAILEVQAQSPQTQAWQVQIPGDPSTLTRRPNPRPGLKNADVVELLPIHLTTNGYAVIGLVQTKHLLRIYQDSPTNGDTRFDLPSETYTVRVRTPDGLDPESWASHLRVTGFDPLNPTRAISPKASWIPGSQDVLLQLPLTDSPRIFYFKN